MVAPDRLAHPVSGVRLGGLVLGTVWLAAAERLSVPTLATQRWLLIVCAACAAIAGAAAARWLPASGATVRDSEGRRVARFLARTHRNVRGATVVFAPNRLYWTTRTFRLARLRRRFTPELGAYFLAVALFSAGFSAFWASLPAYLADDGYAGPATFALYLATSLVAAFCYGSVGGLTDRFDLRLLQAGALVAVGAGVVALLGRLSTPSGGVDAAPESPMD